VSFVADHGTKAVALLALGIVGQFMRPSKLPEEEHGKLAARFKFERFELPVVTGGRAPLSIQKIHPSMDRIAAWISAMGTGVAISDLDGDGLPNDQCTTDPRYRAITIAPLPGTGNRFAPFELVTAPLRYDYTTAPSGCMVIDLNEDGLMDVVVYYWGRPPVAFMRRHTSDPYVPKALSAADFVPRDLVGAGDERWFTEAAIAADFDGDGHVDLLFGNYFRDAGRILDYKDNTEQQSLHDGKGKSYNGGHKHMLLFKGATIGDEPTVQFERITPVIPDQRDMGWTLAMASVDLDGDLLPEIYVSNDFGPDALLHNQSEPGKLKLVNLEGERRLGTPNSQRIGRDTFKGMGADFADVNNDGNFDIYVSNLSGIFTLQETHYLFINEGNVQEAFKKHVAPFHNVSDEVRISHSGFGWDSKAVDFDNDGVLELIQAKGFIKGYKNIWPAVESIGSSNDAVIAYPWLWPPIKLGTDMSGQDLQSFYVRRPDGIYEDVAKEVGIGEPWNCRGFSPADIDDDGDLDFAIACQYGPHFLMRNDAPHKSSLVLDLLHPLQRGTALKARTGRPGADMPGRPAVGAQVRLKLPDGSVRVGQVDLSNGKAGRRAPQVHFGLGDMPESTELEAALAWRDPSGKVQHETIKVKPGHHTVLLGWPN
jgi:hypothetical protein